MQDAYEKQARRLVMERSRCEILEGVLYQVSPDGTLRIIAAGRSCLRKSIKVPMEPI